LQYIVKKEIPRYVRHKNFWYFQQNKTLINMHNYLITQEHDQYINGWNVKLISQKLAGYLK